MRALAYHHTKDGHFGACAPTYSQAKALYWNDLKALVPKQFIGDISESELTITLKPVATRISVIGMDKPYRIEGTPWDGLLLDEYGNMKPGAWGQNVRPALSTPGRPPGWAWLFGVPEGCNHYHELYQFAKDPENNDWDVFWWNSADILTKEEIAAAKAELDPVIFQQEYEGAFVSFEGRAYHAFEASVHARDRLEYDPALPLCFCFDFNIEPGVAAVLQDQRYRGGRGDVADQITAVLGEVHIRRNSRTDIVVRKLCEDWKHHTGQIRCYGDATGGAGGSAKVAGSDWQIIRNMLSQAWPERVDVRVPRENPRERVRINALNGRLRTADGKIHMLIDPRCKRIIEDLDNVSVIPGSAGELDKTSNLLLTHLTDALGYFVVYEHPLHAGAETVAISGIY